MIQIDVVRQECDIRCRSFAFRDTESDGEALFSIRFRFQKAIMAILSTGLIIVIAVTHGLGDP
jgi:hypothetical protein